MALEAEARLLKAGVHAGLLDADKGTAALVVFAQLQQMGATFSFGDFLVERKLLSRLALGALRQSLQGESKEEIRTVSSLGDFELLEMIGEGETGAVFRARQMSLNRIVAIKILSPTIASDAESLRRFHQEARAVARLNHPNIIQGIHVGMDEGLHYFAMELVEGGSVRKLIDENPGGLSEELALKICRQTAEALDCAHVEGLLHRDIKPENLLLTGEGFVKMADLGISMRCERDQVSSAGDIRLKPVVGGQTPTGEFWGSPPYVAPEIIEGRGVNDPRSDLYSLGATFYEMLMGRPPFMGSTPAQTLRLHLSSPPPDLQKLRPSLHPQTASLCLSLLSKEPAGRPTNARAVSEALSALLNQLKIHAGKIPPRKHGTSRKSAPARRRVRRDARKDHSRRNSDYGAASPSRSSQHRRKRNRRLGQR